MLVVNGCAAATFILISHRFGRTAVTDGFFNAYSVYLVLVLAAQAFRVVVVPDLTRAAARGCLGAEAGAYALSFIALGIPLSVAVGLARHPIAHLITGSLPPQAARTAASALVWLVPAAIGQLLAALAASALAARDSYKTAAFGFAAGGVSGLAVFAALSRSHGLVSLAWGLTVSAIVTVAIPAYRLYRLGELRRLPLAGLGLRRRLWQLAQGAALPIAFQGLYVMAGRFAADLGVGRVTSLLFAYILSSTLVQVTASALSLISSAPLTRRGLDPESASRHVVDSSWVSTALVAGATGVLALAAGPLAGHVLGGAYKGSTGHELGRLILWFSPWTLVTIAFTVTFPLAFVVDRQRLLVPLALAVLPLHFGITYGLRAAFGLGGVALAMAISTGVALAALMASLSLRMLELTLVGLARLAVVQGGSALLVFGVLDAVAGAAPAAAGGAVLYLVLLFALRRLGLEAAWRYVRALHH